MSDKNLAEVYYQMGRSFHDQDEWQEAIRFYHQAITLDPTLAGAYNDLGTICQSQSQSQEAIHWYQKAISINPSFAEAYYNLGNVFKDQKEWAEAVFYSCKAIDLDPNLPEAYDNLGIAYYQQDQVEKAISCWQKCVQLKPDYVSAQVNLATALSQVKRLEEALQIFRKALSLDPNQALPWMNLGNIHSEKGEIKEAITCYRKALNLDPSMAAAYMNLGSLAMEQKHLDGAILCYQQALKLNPCSAETCYNLANAYKDKGEIEPAIDLYQKAIRFRPDYHQAFNNLALVLQGQGRHEESIGLFNQALELNPELTEVLNNLGNVLKEQGRTDEALEQFKKAVSLNPEYPEGHWNLSLTLLLIGLFAEGWPEYEWRWKLKGVIFRKDIQQPLWDGNKLEGKRILLYAEQGLGDTIQFIRYVPLVIERGGRVIVECQPELIPLLASMPGIEEIIPYGNSLPAFDVQCPLLSLPMTFKTDFSHIPASIPYLSVDDSLVKKWRDRLAKDMAPKSIGLVWAGKPDHSNDRNRSFSLAALEPLTQVPGVIYYSLQKGEAAHQAQSPPEGMNLVDMSDELHDFAETGALIKNLDLVISADTAVTHLAGALGKPVWTLLPFSPDWRWLLDREDTPWYPTMRLFRQTSYSDWSGVIRKVAAQLENRFSKN